MKFLADMGISPRTVAKLRKEGYDAVHLIEEGLEKLEDREILTKARNEGRIVLTVDLDFGYLLAVSGAILPSVILFRLGNESREVIEEYLDDVLLQFSEELMAGAIISVKDDGFRVRLLPIK
jgi:predicted nuclease of predicted toxin-antitoxin system